MEGPPAKVIKIDFGAPLAQDETMENQDNGQEEWLSEGVLTDEDLSQSAGHDLLQTENTSQEDSQPSITDYSAEDQDTENLDDAATAEHEMASLENADADESLNVTDKNNSEMDTSKVEKSEDCLNEELGMFLIRKSDGKVDVVVERKSSTDFEAQGSKFEEQNEDGNNTDELLRMLGDDDNKTKKLQKRRTLNEKKQNLPSQDDSTDDDYEDAKVTTMKVSKHVSFIKKLPKKADPDDMSDSEASADEPKLVRNMFRGPTTRNANVAAKSTTKPSVPVTKSKTLIRRQASKPEVTKPEVTKTVNKQPTSTPIKQYVNKSKGTVKKPPPSTPKGSNVTTPQTQIKKIANKMETRPPELEDDDFDMDELADEEDDSQRMMRPELMDEEIPSDDDTEPSEGSFYDELPSSESEEVEEWFALDIRAERAGDYIPLLGHRAYDLLTDERKRVDSKLTTLREGISSLAEKSKEQTRQIEEARRSLAALDALLTHT